MIALRQDCRYLLPTVVCRQHRPWGDIKCVVLGVDERERLVHTNSESRITTFAFLVYWKRPDTMTRFKDPDRESVSRYGTTVKPDWWNTEVQERFKRLGNAGAKVQHQVFHLWEFEARGPLIWQRPEAMTNMSRLAHSNRQKLGAKLGCKDCCIM